MKYNLKIGNVVVLNSGGQHMTIVGFNEDGTVQCHWFQHGCLSMQTYMLECLQPAYVETPRSDVASCKESKL